MVLKGVVFLLPYQLKEEQKKFNEMSSVRIRNVYRYLTKHAAFISDDKEGEKSNLHKSVRKFFEKISNSKNVSLLHLFNTLDDESIGKFLLSSKEDKRNSVTRTSIANLKKSYEVDIRSCIDGNNTEAMQFNFLNFWLTEARSTNDSNYANHAFFVANYFTYLLEERSSYTKRRPFPPKSLFLSNFQTESLSDLHFYSDNFITRVKNKSPIYFDYLYKPNDLFYMLILNASEDLIRQVDNCFDYFALCEKNPEHLSSFKNKMDDLINKFEILINQITTDNNVALNIDNYDYISTKKNRDSIFNSLSFLYNATNTSYEFSVLNKKDLDDKSKIYHYKEGQKKPTDFDGNLKNINDFLNHYPFFENDNHVMIEKGLPTIGLFFDMNSIMLEKVLFHEFVIGHSEHRNHQIHGITDGHSTSLLQSKLTTLLDRMVLELKNSSKGIPDFNNKNRGIFDSVKVSIDKNSRNTDLYTLSVYMTEKIRRGYYREYQMMDWYKISFQTASKLKELFINLLYIKSIPKSIYLLSRLSVDLNLILLSYCKMVKAKI